MERHATGWLMLLVAALLGFAAAHARAGSFPVLVFSKTAGFRHDSIPKGIAAIKDLGTANNFDVVATEDAAIFTDAGLVSFKAVIFLSTTGDILDLGQQAAFERYIRAGGGFVGIHSASDTEYSWPWYGGLVGAYFNSHPAIQNANVIVEDTNDLSTTSLPATWLRNDEWYNFQTNPRTNVHVLCRLDESSYTGGTMGDHPIAWSHNYDGGRAWYTAGGHTAASYAEPLFRMHLLGGIRYAAGVSIERPARAIMLFDGTNTSAWVNTAGGPISWPVLNGALQVNPGSGSIQTVSNYSDFQLHVEFRIPTSPSNTAEQSLGNSGVYLQSRYEIQILDSYGRTLTGANDGAAIYGQKDADANAALPDEKWETYDMTFRAARWQGATKIQNATVTVYWNSILVQDNAEIPLSTQAGAAENSSPGPVLLQDLHGLIQFRNIWILPAADIPAAPVTLVSTGSVWKYLDNGSNQGTNWSQITFNDAGWASGPAMLGYGDANGVFPRTTNSYGPNANNKYITTYYRRPFTLTNTWGFSQFTARLQRDDGAVGYLNGIEAFRSNMPTGAVSSATLAATAVGATDETRFYLIPIDPRLLRKGLNVLAVEIHQSATNSSDIAFDLALQADLLSPPRMNLASSGSSLGFSWPGYADGLALYSSTNLRPPVAWVPVTNSVSLSNNLFNVCLQPEPNLNHFFRLQSP